MGNPDEERATINVKGVSVEQWKRARPLAGRNAESMGEWLSRAIKLLADMEEGGREFGPGEPEKPRKAMTPEQVAALLQGVAATGGSRQQAAIDLRRLAAEMAREALGLDPVPVRSIARTGNLTRQNGQSRLIDQERGGVTSVKAI